MLFLQGGASLQFSMIPMNLLKSGTIGSYCLTGSWSEKALVEAKKIGETEVASSSKQDNYRYIPSTNDTDWSKDSAYLHITSNNTIYGTQYRHFPETGQLPLIADMSSDILSRSIDVSKFGMIYAGAQKNLGPSGVTVVIMRKDLIAEHSNLPTMLDYSTHAKAHSLYNTPPTLAIYILSLVLEWVKEQGGTKSIAKLNEEKANLLYKTIDQSDGFYQGHATEDSRSYMNVTFTLNNQEKTKTFLSEAKEHGFIGLNGHRSIGGCRASIYNAVPYEHCYQLTEFMKNFQRRDK